jgi:hypothetical protein
MLSSNFIKLLLIQVSVKAGEGQSHPRKILDFFKKATYKELVDEQRGCEGGNSVEDGREINHSPPFTIIGEYCQF